MVRSQFAAYCDGLSREPEAAKAGIREAISKLQGRTEEARAVVQIGVLVSRADGVLEMSDETVIRQINEFLGLSPGEINL